MLLAAEGTDGLESEKRGLRVLPERCALSCLQYGAEEYSN